MEQFEIFWSGAKERAGECPGLSRMLGPSSLVPGFEHDGLDYGEVKGNGPTKRVRGDDRQPRIAYRSLDPAILPRLKRGESYGAIVRAMGCSMSVVRKVAQRNGIDRSMFGGRQS